MNRNEKSQTAAQKILSKHCGKKYVEAGEIVNADVDLVLGNDITMPLAIEEFKKTGAKSVFDVNKIAIVPDHFTPNKDIKSAQQAKKIREFAREYNIRNYFEIGCMGIEHALIPEKGLALPGNLIIGADSHTCTYGALGALSTGMGSTDVGMAMATGKTWFMVPKTIKFNLNGNLKQWVTGKDIILYVIGKIGVDGALYKSMEFTGTTIESISMDERFTIANMAIEAGAKFGFFNVDEKTIEFLEKTGKNKEQYEIYTSDDNAEYDEIINMEAHDIDLLVAAPHLPSNVRKAEELGDIEIDQVVIGSCTNGRIEDLRIANDIIAGKKVNPEIRTIIIPATQKIYLDALKAGYIENFIKAGCVVSTPTCGPCLGGHMGILAEGERAVSTTNRNFVGRMGHPESEVYLAGPAVAAASALTGKISIPE
ncbi:MAG TPA: 3-isopropylmalate dehydratase large subunit [Actinobacteria bacterium]|nr:3-isopropylmalate dehydratase large subunit [Actinomycetota bacterium]